MFKAINKETNELVSSIDIYNDASYQNPKKDIWYAPEAEILNLDDLKKDGKINSIEDVKVFYVSEGKKQYKTKEGFFLIRPHFNLKDKSEIGIITRPQDILHQKLTNWLFNYIQNKGSKLDLIYSTYYINKKKKQQKIKIIDLPIDIPNYEITIQVINGEKVRADIFIGFKKRDYLFGDGIIFEIQLTKQKDDKIEESTLDRALGGYSVCWLNKDDFIIGEEEYILKNEVINIDPFASILKKQSKNIFKNWVDVTQQQSRLITEKINEHSKIIDNKIKEINEVFKSNELSNEIQCNQISKLLKENKKILQQVNEQSFEKLKERQTNFLDKIEDNELYEIIKSKVTSKISNELSNQLHITMENQLTEYKEYANNKLMEFHALGKIMKIPCPNCGSTLRYNPNGKFGPFIGCTTYPNCKWTQSLKYIGIKDD